MSKKIESHEAVYFSEERISKTKKADKEFCEEVRRDERRIISEYMSKRIIPLTVFKEEDPEATH